MSDDDVLSELRSVLSVLAKDIYFWLNTFLLRSFLLIRISPVLTSRRLATLMHFVSDAYLFFNILFFALRSFFERVFFKKSNVAPWAPSLLNTFVSLKGGSAGKLAESARRAKFSPGGRKLSKSLFFRCGCRCRRRRS